MLMERKRIGEQQTMSTEFGSSSQSVIHLRFSKCMEDVGGLVQRISTVCLDEIVGFVTSEMIKERRLENVTTSLNISSSHSVEVLAILPKERLRDQSCVLSSRSIHLSVSRSQFIADRYTLCQRDSVKNGTFIPDRPEIENQV